MRSPAQLPGSGLVLGAGVGGTVGLLGAGLDRLLLGGGISTSIGLVAGAAIDAFASHPRGRRNASDAAGFPREQSVTAPMIAVSAAATMES